MKTEIVEALAAMPLVFLCIAACTDATCNTEQRYRCQRAAEDGELETTRGGGAQCIAKQYVQFTHVCTVVNYVPSIDFCCCAVRPSETLCCRYHQDWNHFRCVESDDIIETPAVTSSMSGYELAAVTVSGLAVGACVLTFAACCCCCRAHGCRHRRRPARRAQQRDLFDDDDEVDVYSSCAASCPPTSGCWYSWCDGISGNSDDDVIKIASAGNGNGAGAGAQRRASSSQDDAPSGRGACADRLPLSDWPPAGTVAPSAPLLPSVVCLDACRNGGYQTVTLGSVGYQVVPPPTYAESVCRCADQSSSSSTSSLHRQNQCRPRFDHHDHRDSSPLNNAQAVHLNYYTTRA